MEWAWFCFGMTLSHILAPFLLFTFNLGVEQGAMAASLQGLDKWIVWSAWHSHLKLWMYWLGSVYSRRHSRKMLLLFRVFNTSWANGSQQRNKINSGCKSVSLTTKSLRGNLAPILSSWCHTRIYHRSSSKKTEWKMMIKTDHIIDQRSSEYQLPWADRAVCS